MVRRRAGSVPVVVCAALIVVASAGPVVAAKKDGGAPVGELAAQTTAADTFTAAPIGAAREVKGGSGDKVVVVRTLADRGRGSLREAVKRTGSTVLFAVSGEVVLRSSIEVSSQTTIDGRGADVTIVGKGLVVQGDDVIIRNLKIRGDETSDSNEDAIAIRGEANGVWIDHVDLSSFEDGLLDVTQRATNVTISWSRLHDHGKTALLGAASSEGSPPLVDMTVHHTEFVNTGERNPLMRHGRFHVFDNLIQNWGYGEDSGYAMRAGCGTVALVEANTFISSGNPRAISIEDSEDGERTCDPGRAPAIRLVDNEMNGLEPRESKPEQVLGVPADAASVEPVSAALTERVRALAGWQAVANPIPIPAADEEATSSESASGADDTERDRDFPWATYGWVVGAFALALGAVVLVVGHRTHRARR